MLLLRRVMMGGTSAKRAPPPGSGLAAASLDATRRPFWSARARKLTTQYSLQKTAIGLSMIAKDDKTGWPSWSNYRLVA